ncbi:unnamed protein product [Victoria cruziana]
MSSFLICRFLFLEGSPNTRPFSVAKSASIFPTIHIGISCKVADEPCHVPAASTHSCLEINLNCRLCG